MQRVKGEEKGNGCTGPERSAQPPEEQQQEDPVCSVQGHVHQVMPGRIEPEELHIEHVGEPGERVPVGCMGGGHGPGDPLEGHPLDDVLVVVDILVIVEIDEVVAGAPAENCTDRHKQQDGDGGDPEPLIGSGPAAAAMQRFPAHGVTEGSISFRNSSSPRTVTPRLLALSSLLPASEPATT